jgi:hypothetical protein
MLKFIKASYGGAEAMLPLEKSSSASDQVQQLVSSGQIMPEIQEWIRRNPLDHDTYAYSIVVPVGACESWGETLNGDGFERSEISPSTTEYGHKTFETEGRAYAHHQNKGDAYAFGDTPMMCWNPEMDRVEGIWRLNRAQAKQKGAGHFVDKLDQGRPVEISMGCHVPYDVCTMCGNQARTREEWCTHTRDPGFGSIDPISMIRMMVLNPKPRFFDLSGVLAPAAPEALTLGPISYAMEAAIRDMQKCSGVRSYRMVVPSAVIGEALYRGDGLMKVASRATPMEVQSMIKQVPALTVAVLNPVDDDEMDVDAEDALRAKKSGCSLPQWLSTLAALGVVLRPWEFLASHRVFSDRPYNGGDTLSASSIHAHLDDPRSVDACPMSPLAFHHGLAHGAMAAGLIEDRSATLLPLTARAAHALETDAVHRSCRPKPAGTRITVEVTGPEARAYAGYIRTLLLKLPEFIRHGTSNNALVSSSLTCPTKLSSHPAPLQLVLPSAYILAKASATGNVRLLKESVDAFSSSDVSAILTGAVRP